ncbi:UNKNOWN [Stylonychia lemnae]|uniref:Transmembrane protein n=1 Tax=Stylonychia lemnae TaxID=5949 RepID=A0A078B2N5_STYLE|nr:UNKNOWN [Stylonychia lemnae]|eukprot:CDW88800.1 UNKNOWN [Stylonychia lemnae]
MRASIFTDQVKAKQFLNLDWMILEFTIVNVLEGKQGDDIIIDNYNGLESQDDSQSSFVNEQGQFILKPKLKYISNQGILHCMFDGRKLILENPNLFTQDNLKVTLYSLENVQVNAILSKKIISVQSKEMRLQINFNPNKISFIQTQQHMISIIFKMGIRFKQGNLEIIIPQGYETNKVIIPQQKEENSERIVQQLATVAYILIGYESMDFIQNLGTEIVMIFINIIGILFLVILSPFQKIKFIGKLRDKLKEVLIFAFTIRLILELFLSFTLTSSMQIQYGYKFSRIKSYQGYRLAIVIIILLITFLAIQSFQQNLIEIFNESLFVCACGQFIAFAGAQQNQQQSDTVGYVIIVEILLMSLVNAIVIFAETLRNFRNNSKKLKQSIKIVVKEIVLKVKSISFTKNPRIISISQQTTGTQDTIANLFGSNIDVINAKISPESVINSKSISEDMIQSISVDNISGYVDIQQIYDQQEELGYQLKEKTKIPKNIDLNDEISFTFTINHQKEIQY